MSSSPVKKKPRLSSEEITLKAPQPPTSRPPPNAEARRRRQLAIAAALSQPENVLASQEQTISSAPPESPLLRRDGLTNATNLVLTPKKDPPGQSKKGDSATVFAAQADVNTSQDVFGGSQASTTSVLGSTDRSISNALVGEEEAKAHEMFALSSPTALLRGASPLDGNSRPVTPPPSEITRVEPGVFFTASHRRVDLSAAALAEARQFAARVDLDLPPEVDPDDEMAVIGAMKSSHFQLSQGARKPSMSFHPPLRHRIQADAPSTPVRLPLFDSRTGSGTRAPAHSQSTPLKLFPSGSHTPICSPAQISHMLPTSVIGSPTAALSTPIASSQRSLGMTARRNGTPVSARNKPFVTPFKTGFGPSSSSTPQRGATTKLAPIKAPMHAILAQAKSRPTPPQLTPTSNVVRRDEKPRANVCFDTRAGEPRISMKDFGLLPGAYSFGDLLNHGVPAVVLYIQPANAAEHHFRAESSQHVLGYEAALEHLRSRGCTLATSGWVKNHWSLILWKRASIICCKPDLFKSLWTFEGMCEGLMHHYERDLNRTQRPVLRLILERDATPARPMVLAVSSIWWAPQEMDESGKAILLPHPTLELTDGWYRIRTEVDEALARATRRRKIRLGTKIVIAGAKMNADGEPREALKAYDESTLVISGNSTTLARWDARLGPLLHDIPGKTGRGIIPSVASLRSLTPDGGLTMMIDIVVERLHPVGFIETLPDGTRLAPVNEAGNQAAEASWERGRLACLEEEKEKLDNALSYLAGFSNKAQSLSKGCAPCPDDDEPDRIDSVVEDLEDSDDKSVFFKQLRLSPMEYAWLARHIDKRIEERRVDAAHLLETELKDRWPARNVSNFRTIIVRDARPLMRYTVERTAQLTMWNVLSLGPEFLVEGRRYMVSNVIPSNASSWAGHREDGEIILKSTTATRWRAIR